MSLHAAARPDKNAFEGASNAELGLEKLDNTMSFAFETRFLQHLTSFRAGGASSEDYMTAGGRWRRSSTDAGDHDGAVGPAPTPDIYGQMKAG